MIIGFTGTRTEPTWQQRNNLRKFVENTHIGEVHHGACTGADELMHQTALIHSVPSIVVHPPLKTMHMMAPDWNHDNVIVLPPKGYYERDIDIVTPTEPVDLLLAMPNTPRRPHSGTWLTIDIADAANVPVLILWPDGRMEPYLGAHAMRRGVQWYASTQQLRDLLDRKRNDVTP